MEVLILIVIGLMVLGCWEFRVVGVAMIDDNAKAAKSKILPEANGTDTLAAHFASLSPSINELKLSKMVGQEG